MQMRAAGILPPSLYLHDACFWNYHRTYDNAVDYARHPTGDTDVEVNVGVELYDFFWNHILFIHNLFVLLFFIIVFLMIREIEQSYSQPQPENRSKDTVSGTSGSHHWETSQYDEYPSCNFHDLVLLFFMFNFLWAKHRDQANQDIE